MDALPDRANAAVEVLGGGTASMRLYTKPTRSDKIMIAEKSNHFPPPTRTRSGEYSLSALSGTPAASRPNPTPSVRPEHAFVGGKPLESQFGRNRQRFSETDPSEGHSPSGAFPKTRSW
jgi:hypothetical protein